MMPLAIAHPGENLKLVALHGGQTVRKRLADLGLTLDMPLRVVQGNGHGPFIITVKDTRLAIGRGMAHHIMVEACE
ncbi:MAG: ferrous iron transport protein A [Anaerolineae bacterium]|nr:ferrous iron transport protein A [Anaerolineae bacterium]